MHTHCIYREAMRVGTCATPLMLTGATLPNDVQGPPPPRHPLNLHFVHAGFAEPNSITMTIFSRHSTNMRILGSAEPRIQWNANSLDLQRCCACWNFRNFSDVDWCNLA